ncbi:RNA polymerase sigma factor [Iamia sp. SCSIO 61187]|uniref:RNA polymerase sigma factor n=1 Tax=Iamia sp. SCSIO 61187 TaxID=2722752 RepID=UPI001C625296|nr:RNA polymerase sigma factor [Iamia sp. SCSIO 61187]
MGDGSGLVERLRGGDEDALVEVMDRYQPALLRAAEATVGSRAVAEEVCQETWLAVVQGIGEFQGRSSFRTWLFHIMRNRARTCVGRERRAGRPDSDLVERAGACAAWALPSVPSSEGVDDRLDAAGLARRVVALLPELPDQQRRVVVLHDVEGLGNHDVAARLGLSDGHERVLLHRGRARLRALLDGSGPTCSAAPSARRRSRRPRPSRGCDGPRVVGWSGER